MMDYDERETLKHEGWRQAHDRTRTVEDRAYGLLKVIQAHFIRSAEAHKAEYGNRRRHGSWNAYTASWLAANGNRTDGPFQGLERVVGLLRTLYPPPPRPRIPPGRSYWE